MTRKCIVPRCRSGYKNNKERVSLFHVPKDKELKKKWVNAIPNTRVVLKFSHLVCEKHFLETDIIRHFVHKDAAGNIIAKIAYKCARLVNGSVPSVFSVIEDPNIEDDEEVSQHPITNSTTVPDDCPNENIFAEKSMGVDYRTVEISHNYQIKIDNGTYTDEIIKQNSDSNWKLQDAFPKILENPDSVEIPKHWFRNARTIGKKWIVFSTFDVKEQPDSLQPIIRKSVLVSEDGSVHISAHGKTVSPSNLSPSLPVVETVKDLKMLLTTLSCMGICSGVTILKIARSVQSSFVYQDNFGIWRHKNCPLVYLKKQCTCCRRLTRSIQETNRRRTQQNTKSKRIRLLANNERDKMSSLFVK